MDALHLRRGSDKENSHHTHNRIMKTHHHTVTRFITPALAALCLIPASTWAATLKVTVSNIQKQEGVLKLDLFKEEAQWLQQSIRSEKLSADASQVLWEIKDLEPGTYAISAIHDVNGNDQLDTGTFGIPTEPYGFSNDARGMFGPAKWEKAVFTVSEGEQEHLLKVE
jgi:uncharacterized protein (DUF2141 family)